MTVNGDGKILISISEFVSISRRKIARITVGTDREADTENGFIKNFELMGFSFQLFGASDRTSPTEISLVKQLKGDKTAPSREEVKQVRGELFILGYIHASNTGLKEITLEAIYENRSLGRSVSNRERVALSALTKFYNSCADALEKYGTPEIERATERVRTLSSIKFPFNEIRDGQSELVKSVYRCIARKGELLISAPTGTGKTVSVIYPAIRAVGDGRCERVFYLTPKTTTANAAAECIELLSRHGAKIRAVRLTAKEKICKISALCKSDPLACTLEREKGVPEAALYLSRLNLPVAGEGDIKKAAAEFGVCPYELSLAYSELCDFIICDVNYAFDPSVHLERYFDEGGNYALLVDEAHNLVPRAREMYSAELSLSELSALAEACEALGLRKGFASEISEVESELHATLYPYLKETVRTDRDGKKIGATHLSDIPSPIYELSERLHLTLEEELMKEIRSSGEEKSIRILPIKEFLHKVSKFRRITELFDEGFKLILFLDGEDIKIKLLSIDTGNIIKSVLKSIGSAVFFSATLEPMDYYRYSLGLDRGCDTVTAKSPFDPSALSVTIMDKISTRVSERERTREAVCRVIAATLSARRGHYMVYAPSFEYAELLFRAFTAKYPKIKALLHTPNMSISERENFLNSFDEAKESYLIGFSVMGGIYSEGIDLKGNSLIGAIVVGIGMPSLSYEREAIAEYYEDKLEAGRQYAYIYPGMNKVFQAAGRVIRREDDRGVIVLIDDRFDDPIYKKSIPDLWRGMRYCGDPKELRVILDAFWKKVDEE